MKGIGENVFFTDYHMGTVMVLDEKKYKTLIVQLKATITDLTIKLKRANFENKELKRKLALLQPRK